jgi:pantoate kinase
LSVSEAFCPAGISSFFEICDHDSTGNPLDDPAKIGARGGGFALARGVTSKVTVRDRKQTRIRIVVNSKPMPEAYTTLSAMEDLIEQSGKCYDVLVETKVTVPIAAGFGTSAAGTLAACLAFSDAVDLPVTLIELGRLTHVAEVVNRTGLGTASALLSGGFVLVKEPGAPGIGLVDRLRFPLEHSLVCAYLGSIQTREVLANRVESGKGGTAARVAMDAIRRRPTLSTFLEESRKFGAYAGFETPKVSRLISMMVSAGAVGAAQNMLGEAVHGVARNSRAKRVVAQVRKAFPQATVFTSSLDTEGVRILKTNAKH